VVDCVSKGRWVWRRYIAERIDVDIVDRSTESTGNTLGSMRRAKAKSQRFSIGDRYMADVECQDPISQWVGSSAGAIAESERIRALHDGALGP